MKILTEAWGEYELIEISERNKTDRGGEKQGNSNGTSSTKILKSRDRSRSNGEDRWKESITCHSVVNKATPNGIVRRRTSRESGLERKGRARRL